MAERRSSAVSNSTNEESNDKVIYFDLNLIEFPRLLTREEILLLNELDIESARLQLAGKLRLDCEMEMPDAIITDYYFWNYWWAKCHLIDDYKIEAVLTLSLFLLNNLREHKLDQEENLKLLKKVISSAAVAVEHESSTSFRTDELTQFLEYMGINFFQHYRLYECCFRRHRKEMTIYHAMVIETIAMESVPSPLKEAMSETTFKNQIDPNYPPVYVASHRDMKQNVTFFLQKIHGN